MTIEEKAKAYDEVLEKISRIMETGVEPVITRGDVQDFFPELKESDYEKVRKALLKGFKEFNNFDVIRSLGVSVEDAIAWLEKQGEQKPTIKRVYQKFDIGDTLYRKGYADHTVKSIHDCANPVYICENDEGLESHILFSEQDEWSVKQKSAEWGWEDDQFLTVCHNALTKYQASDKWDAGIISRWLENKLRSTPSQSKQEWSEDDKKLMKNLESTLSNLYARNLIEKETKEKYTSWLKSLRPQNRWKPTNLQLECLSDAIEDYRKHGYNATILASLLNQLQKITE